MNLCDFYILVDIEKKIIIDKIQKLPDNWRNISGLSGLSENELINLEWAGHFNLGWFRMTFNNIKDFYSSPDNLQLNKNELKKIISTIRKEKQNEVIIYNSAKIKSDILTRYSLELLKERQKINYKSINGYYVFNSVDIKNICDMIDKQTQNYFDIEKNIYEQINKCTSITDFLNINYDF